MKQVTRMATASGQPVLFLDPPATVVLWEDLVVTGKIYRFGAVLDWTVLQHSCLVTKLAHIAGASKKVQAYCAAHDLHEAYVGDIPAPLKEVVPEFRDVELPWMEHVHKSLGMEWPVPEEIEQEVKHHDLRALVVEADVFEHPLKKHIADKLGAPSSKEKLAIEVFADAPPSAALGVVRMYLAGAGFALSGEDTQPRVCAKRHAAQFTVPSESDPSTKYVVRKKVGGMWSCTCPHFLIRNKTCKHIISTKAEHADCDWASIDHGGAALAPQYKCPKCFGATKVDRRH